MFTINFEMEDIRMLLEVYGIRFPGIGIKLGEYAKAIKLPGISIPYMVVAVLVGIIIGYIFTIYEARRTWQDSSVYVNGSIVIAIIGIIGARLFDVIINWKTYSNSPIHVLNINRGGANYTGAVVTVILTCILIAYNKRISVFRMLDTLTYSVVIVHICAYIGQFFSRNSYGDFTKSKMAMQIPLNDTSGIMNQMIQDNIVEYEGVSYIQVHPICIYKILIMLVVLIALLIIRRKKRFDGEILAYGVCGKLLMGFIVDFALYGRTLLIWKISFVQVLEFIAFTVILCVVLSKRHKINVQMESKEEDKFKGKVISRFIQSNENTEDTENNQDNEDDID